MSDKDEKPNGDPWILRIGVAVYINGVFNGGQPAFFKDSATIFPVTMDFVSTHKTTVVCNVVGEDRYRGKPAIRIHVQRCDRDQGNVVWLDRWSGLPVYAENDEKSIALAFECGDAVKDPAVRR